MARNQVATSINDLSDRIMQYGSIAGNREGRAADRYLKSAEIDLADRRYTDEEARRSAADLRSQEVFNAGAPTRELESMESTDKLSVLKKQKETPWTSAKHEILQAGGDPISNATWLAQHSKDEVKFLYGDKAVINQDGTITKSDGKIVTEWERNQDLAQEKIALFWTSMADPKKHLEGIMETGTPEERAKASEILKNPEKLYSHALDQKLSVFNHARLRGAPAEKLKMLQKGIDDTKEELKRYRPLTAMEKMKFDKQMLALDKQIAASEATARKAGKESDKLSESAKALLKVDAERLGKLQEDIGSLTKKTNEDGTISFAKTDDTTGMEKTYSAAEVARKTKQINDLTKKIQGYNTQPTAGLQPAAAQAQVAPVPQAAQPLKAPVPAPAPTPANQPKAANAQRDVKIIQMLKPDDPRLGAAVQEFLQRYPEMEEEVSRIIAEKQAGAAPAVVAPSWVTGLNKPSGVGR